MTYQVNSHSKTPTPLQPTAPKSSKWGWLSNLFSMNANTPSHAMGISTSPITSCSTNYSEGVAIDPRLTKECGARGNCFLYSLLDQLNAVDPDRSNLRDSDSIRQFVAQFAREHRDEILINDILMGHIETDVRAYLESRGQRDEIKADRSTVLDYYTDCISQDGFYLDKGFANLFSLATDCRFQIALVQKNSTQDPRCNIVALFPNDRRIDPKDTLFVYHTGSHQESRPGDHYQSLRRENPDLFRKTVRDLAITRDYHEIPNFTSFNRQLGREMTTIPENPTLFYRQINEDLLNHGKTYDALCIVAYDRLPHTTNLVETDAEKVEMFKQLMRFNESGAGEALIDAVLNARPLIMKKIDELYQVVPSESLPNRVRQLAAPRLLAWPDEARSVSAPSIIPPYQAISPSYQGKVYEVPRWGITIIDDYEGAPTAQPQSRLC